MAIYNSLIDRIATGEDQYTAPALVEKDCAWCNKTIEIDQPYWFWFFGGDSGFLKMHLQCFLIWLPRLAPDSAEAMDALK